MAWEDVSNAELARWLNRIESKLDTVALDHEQRVRQIERTLWISAGMSAAGITSGLGALLTSVFR